MVWTAQPEETIPPLTCWCFDFIPTDFSLDELDTLRLRRDIQQDNAKCAQHYHEELEAHGGDFEQVRETERAEKDPEYAAVRESRCKLHGLPASQKYPGNMSYHHFVCVYQDQTWNQDGDEMLEIDIVQFDPALTDEDYEPGERIIPQDPFFITRVSAKHRECQRPKGVQDLWGWFMDQRSPDWYHPTVSATFTARHW
ncbi:hypothetical protein HYE67_006919 [Fusarium culmorum]|uniref:Uncharacterized protein n=1 Tax=Fusarium culmorum TaxID=5516 RepID=A0A2T4H455_FUSCU|nr:hypothetical protein FCULG_00007963 [Fusarium culmorum]QPC64688.1 hypothetical protein HYE67_006919 [Fusarium culmorum]